MLSESGLACMHKPPFLMPGYQHEFDLEAVWFHDSSLPSIHMWMGCAALCLDRPGDSISQREPMQISTTPLPLFLLPMWSAARVVSENTLSSHPCAHPPRLSQDLLEANCCTNHPCHPGSRSSVGQAPKGKAPAMAPTDEAPYIGWDARDGGQAHLAPCPCAGQEEKFFSSTKEARRRRRICSTHTVNQTNSNFSSPVTADTGNWLHYCPIGTSR